MKWLLPRHNSSCRRRVEPKREKLLNQKFDETTGQIYFETTAPAQRSDDREWARNSCVLLGPSDQDSELYVQYVRSWKRSGADGDLGEYHNYLDRVSALGTSSLKGSRSLQDTAIECVIQNISDITPEAIECLPSSVVRRLWYLVNRRCTMCFNTWSIFSKILRECEMPTLDLLRYRHVIAVPKSPLPVYANVLTSKSLDFITSLSITVACHIPDLVKLAQVVNLGVLHIVNGTEMLGIGDRLIRAWHSAIMNDGAFQVLRILKLWNHGELTCNSLALVTSFPALAVYDIRGCDFHADPNIRAKQLGWKIAQKADYLDELDQMCQKRATVMSEQTVSKHTGYSQPLPDGARVKFVSRAETLQFLTRIKVKNKLRSPNPLGHSVPPNPLKSRIKPTKAKLGKQKEKPEIRLTSADKSWEFPTYAAFTRIGEIRNDSDLARAGVIIGEQAVVGEDLVNSVPIISLCLGRAPASSIRSRSFVFLRCHVPSPEDTQMGDRVSLSKSMGPTSVGRVGGSNASQNGSSPVFMRAKKRKLNDILGSFL